MRRQDIDESLYDYPYAGLFRDYVQAYTPPRQPLAGPPTPEVNHAADNLVSNDSSKPSPFKRLSLEFIRSIFILTCGEGVLAPSRDLQRDQLRLTLQLVCKDWQRIVTSSPA